MVAEFHRRRDAFCDGLNRIPGVRCARPGGAFYAFANLAETGMDSKTAADFLLNEAGVACLSGAAFGKCVLQVNQHHHAKLGGDASQRDETDAGRDRLIVAEQIEQPQPAGQCKWQGGHD